MIEPQTRQLRVRSTYRKTILTQRKLISPCAVHATPTLAYPHLIYNVQAAQLI